MPDVRALFSLFTQWAPDAGMRRRILVDNPAPLYGFAPASHCGSDLVRLCRNKPPNAWEDAVPVIVHASE